MFIINKFHHANDSTGINRPSLDDCHEADQKARLMLPRHLLLTDAKSPAALFRHQQHFFVISSTFLSPTALSDDWYLAFAPRLVINNNCTVRPMVIGRSQFNHISNLWQTLTMTVIILVCVVFSGCVILYLALSCSKCWKGSFLRRSTMHLHLHNLECVVGSGTRMSN